MPRVSWAELPSQIHSWVAGVLGSAVTSAVSQEGGFSPGAVTAVAAAVAGYFTRQALLPAPAGIPTVRRFQADQGRHARAWLRERTGWN
jgi:hypothetical protein